jgi:type IV pilus assembly protein PilC
LALQTQNTDFKEKILKISEEVEGGASLSNALNKYPRIFSPFYIAMVRAGEASGKLSESLNYLADHLEREYHLTSRIRGALAYPALVITFVIGVLLLMVFFVIPNLSIVLEETGQEMPTLTKMVLDMANFFRRWAWLLAIVLGILIAFLFRYYRTEDGKDFFDRFFLKIPILGRILKTMYVTRFAENLATLISGGLPIARALEITAEIVGNSAYKEVILETRTRVRKGESIYSTLSKAPDIFFPMFAQMTLVGEKTGTLDKTLMNVVSFYQQETERSINDLLRILEPLLIMVLGAIVGGLMFTVLVPLYQIISF